MVQLYLSANAVGTEVNAHGLRSLMQSIIHLQGERQNLITYGYVRQCGTMYVCSGSDIYMQLGTTHIPKTNNKKSGARKEKRKSRCNSFTCEGMNQDNATEMHDWECMIVLISTIGETSTRRDLSRGNKCNNKRKSGHVTRMRKPRAPHR